MVGGVKAHMGNATIYLVMDVLPHHLSILATSEPHATLTHPVRARQVQLQSVRPGAQLK